MSIGDLATTTDEVTFELIRDLPKGNVLVELIGADGTVKYSEYGNNLITDHGDEMMAQRLYDNTANIVTGMRLGTGTTTASKSGAGAAIVTYISGSQEALDSTATDETKGAGSGWRTIFICTWEAGDSTNGAIAEVVLTDETALTDTDGVVGDTVARFKFAATVNKTASDLLRITWNLDHLGS